MSHSCMCVVYTALDCCMSHLCILLCILAWIAVATSHSCMLTLMHVCRVYWLGLLYVTPMHVCRVYCLGCDFSCQVCKVGHTIDRCIRDTLSFMQNNCACPSCTIVEFSVQTIDEFDFMPVGS